MIRKVSAPLRIDIFGGSLDIPPIPTEMGPIHIVSAAINHRVTGTVSDHMFYNNDDNVLHTNNGLQLQYKLPSNIKTGSGLGSSGCMNLVWLALITGSKDRYWLADSVFRIEQATGVVGGTQDQYTAAYGGINLLKMSHDRVWVIPIFSEFCVDVVRKLNNHLVLVDSGITRSATGMNEQFINGYKTGKFYKELTDLNNISLELYDGLSNFGRWGNQDILKMLPNILDREWSIRRVLMPSNTTEIDNIMNEGRSVSKYIGAKCLGAAGGGCVLFACPNIEQVDPLKHHMESIGLNVIDFKFDYDGLIVEEE